MCELQSRSYYATNLHKSVHITKKMHGPQGLDSSWRPEKHVIKYYIKQLPFVLDSLGPAKTYILRGTPLTYAIKTRAVTDN